MRIATLTPGMQQVLLAAVPRNGDAFDLAGPPGSATMQAAIPFGSTQTAQLAPSVQMLVAMAAAEPTSPRRRRELVARAGKGLSMLERLHGALISGAPDVDLVDELASWSHGAEVSDDPQLAALMREIEVRVRVELAKMELRV